MQYDTLSSRAGHLLGPADSFDQRNFSNVNLSWAVFNWAVRASASCILEASLGPGQWPQETHPAQSPSGAGTSLKDEEASIKQKTR